MVFKGRTPKDDHQYTSPNSASPTIMTSASPNSTATPGNLFVISAPSGAGKSSLVHSLLKDDQGLTLSISHTTRPPRGQEQHGQQYWFTPLDEFKHMIDRGEFVEWAQVHQNYYGTSRREIESRLKKGLDVILEIDWQGALQIRNIFPQAALIFILPPSLEELHARLRNRGEDSPQVIQTRLNNAQIELSKASAFNFVIINNIFDTALQDLKVLVQAQRLRYASQQHRNAQVFDQLGIAQLTAL